MATLRRIRSLIELDSVPPSSGREEGENDESFEDEFDESEAGHGEPNFQAFIYQRHRSPARLSSQRHVARPKDVMENELSLLRLPTLVNHDMYVHMTLSEDYREAYGPEVRNASDHELCVWPPNQDRVNGQAFDVLPRLFRDVLAIAARLDLREAPQMAQYYQFFLLTIAGTASDMTDGLLHPYIPTLQEWLLSKRLLWYIPSGLVFECHTTGPRTKSREQIHVDPDTASSGGMTILDFWYRALKVYSACSLTKPEKDRVLGVAGLAKKVELILAGKVGQDPGGQHEVYLSGLWLRDLHRGLLREEERAEGEAWPARSNGERKAASVVGVCQRKRRGRHHHADYLVDARGWAVRRDILGSGEPERARFDATNIFANLHTAAFATAYSPTPESPSQWRAVCAPENPEAIAGWASLEQLNVGESDSGLLLKHVDPVLDLLFLKEINGDSGVFRRLSVGRVFDKDLMRTLGDRVGLVSKHNILQTQRRLVNTTTSRKHFTNTPPTKMIKKINAAIMDHAVAEAPLPQPDLDLIAEHIVRIQNVPSMQGAQGIIDEIRGFQQEMQGMKEALQKETQGMKEALQKESEI
ncbi:hypothetical protein B0H67DRAFT_641899 [Lasiosphaeris hirsuta]|uniref:Uncharacterized protein n=1 Tax=Lasiosphaeris hirsuta TaxID=260670 RepID=A0AA40B0M9_9PEZI|nr:hypothetical protein B0H67DRAFT_641899 [Lasiosphaeris hirsuta]